jgi:thiosulfate reductase/polysulfide reductase chain A
MGSSLKPAINRRIACVEPRFDTKPMWWIVKELAVRLGVGQYFPYGTAEDIWDYQLADLDIGIEDFEETGFVSLSDKAIWWDRNDGINFKTPSGKIEFVSELMESHGIPSMPPYEPLDAETGAFRLMVGRCVAHTNVMTQNNLYLNHLVPENPLWINDKRAKELGIADKDAIEVESEAGRGVMRAFVTDMIHPEAAFMLHGFGHKEPGSKRSYGKGQPDSLFQSRFYDKVGGSPALDHSWVTVKKI